MGEANFYYFTCLKFESAKQATIKPCQARLRFPESKETVKMGLKMELANRTRRSKRLLRGLTRCRTPSTVSTNKHPRRFSKSSRSSTNCVSRISPKDLSSSAEYPTSGSQFSSTIRRSRLFLTRKTKKLYNS